MFSAILYKRIRPAKFPALLAISAFLLAPISIASGGGEVNPEVCIWKGTITLQRKGSGRPVQPKPERGKTVTVSGARTVEENITIDICGQPGSMYVKSATRTLQDDYSYSKNEQIQETLCRFPKEMLRPGAEWPADHSNYVPEKKRPGSHSKAVIENHTKILQEQALPELREKTDIILSLPDPARFVISGSQTAFADYQSDLVDTSYDACAEITSVKEIHERTGALGQAPKSDHKTGNQGWNTQETITHTNPPRELRKEFHTEAPFTGLQLKDSKVIDRIETPEFESTETASWDLKGESPCPDVYDQLQQDLAYAEAYAEKNVSDFAGSMDEYETLVEDRAYRIRYGVNAPRGEDSAEIDAATDEQGAQHGMEKLRQKLKAECKPDIIFESISAHENIHTNQQEKFPDYNDGKPRTRGLMEVSAYVVDAQMLVDWLRDNCPGTNLSNADSRLQHLEKIAGRYTPD
jgi:hypothetical protein